MKQHADQQGFTLIELLVVIAIIAILSALIFPAVTGVLKKGKVATAQTEVKSIENALNAYYADYSKFPKDNGTADKTYGASGNKDIITVLRGLDNDLNPRRINYLEVSEKSLDGDGNMIDPWRTNYFIAVNTDFNTTLAISGAGVTLNLQARNVAVWTRDSEGQLIKSW